MSGIGSASPDRPRWQALVIKSFLGALVETGMRLSSGELRLLCWGSWVRFDFLKMKSLILMSEVAGWEIVSLGEKGLGKNQEPHLDEPHLLTKALSGMANAA